MRRIIFIGALILTIFIIVFMGAHRVSEKLTIEDKTYIAKILEEAGYDYQSFINPTTFDAQLDAILSVQKSGFHTAKETGRTGDLNSAREPKNLYAVSAAYCGDRARYMDKAFRLLGLESRFVSLYEKQDGKNIFQTLLSRGGQGTQSHALLEVKTNKGWLIVDSRHQWLSVTDSGDVISLANWSKEQSWSSKYSSQEPYPLLEKDFYKIYGLYSRHGKFYPPFTPYIPDISWGEFRYNY